MPTSIDFGPLLQSGIPMSHFARLCGASRISVFKWVRRQANPRGLYRDSVLRQLESISKAMQRGVLPLPPTPREKKYENLLSALHPSDIN